MPPGGPPVHSGASNLSGVEAVPLAGDIAESRAEKTLNRIALARRNCAGSLQNCGDGIWRRQSKDNPCRLQAYHKDLQATTLQCKMNFNEATGRGAVGRWDTEFFKTLPSA